MRKKIIPFILLISIFVVLLLPIAVSHEGEDHTIKLPENIQKSIQQEETKAINLTFLAVFIAGLVAITSPCGFVLIPTFIAYTFRNRKKALVMSAGFSIGIMITFLIFGVIASLVGNFFNPYKQYFALISGIAILIFAIMIFFNKGFSFFTPKVNHSKKGFLTYILFGIFFAGGWTPCIGPVLTSIFFLAANMDSMFKSVLLLLVYSLGMIIPLITLSVIADKYDAAKYIQGKTRTIKLFSKKIQTTTYNIISAIILGIIGLIMIIQKGTTVFETYLQTSTPWTMSVLLKVNTSIQQSEFLKTQIANILGVILVLILLALIYYKIKKNNNKINFHNA